MIDCQNVVFIAYNYCPNGQTHVKNLVAFAAFKNFVIQWKSHAPLLRYSIFYILNHCESSDVTISISTRCRVHF